jgi:hypothetical protein
VQAVLLVAEHWPHAPDVWQAGAELGHWLSFAHGWQRWAVVLQTGVVPPHCALVLQLAHTPSATLQTGVVPEHFVTFVAEQTPHEPFGWQAGVAPGHWLSLAQAWQTCALVLQTGVVPPHSAFDTHGTQVPPATLQAGVAPVHLIELEAEHWPHEPFGWQAGVAPPQSESVAHAWHVCRIGSHTGVAPEQSLLTRHVTHVPVVV